MIALSRLEVVVDAPALATELAGLEARLPIGVRPRQLGVRVLVLGVLLALADGRPQHLSRVAPGAVRPRSGRPADQARLGVIACWRSGPHQLTYRQVEHTMHLVEAALRKDRPNGTPSLALDRLCDLLCEASIPAACKDASASYAIDWTDVASFFRPPGDKDGPCVDPEASWGHRRGDGPDRSDELFFDYYGSLMTMTVGEHGPAVPELIRRSQLTSCRVDPVPSFVTVVATSVASGVVVHQVLADCGYSHKVPEHFAYPLRAAGVGLVIDLHPADRGQKGTHAGAVGANGNLYCPATPKALFELGPIHKGASEAEMVAHDAKTAELSAYKLGRLCADDEDGYFRVCCPAELGKLACPLRPASMGRSGRRPEVYEPPAKSPTCCVQRSVTVPPQVNAKTRQDHDYPGPSWRGSYGRRSAAERSNSMLKNPASINIDQKGWCKLAGVVPTALFFALACVVVNLSLIDAFEANQAAEARRAVLGTRPPRARRWRRRRRRRRRTLAEMAWANAPP